MGFYPISKIEIVRMNRTFKVLVHDDVNKSYAEYKSKNKPYIPEEKEFQTLDEALQYAKARLEEKAM
jgi:hypothetical protein